MKAKDIMITKVFTVKPTTTLKDLLYILYSNKINGVPVVDDKNRLLGMVYDADLLRYLAPKPLTITEIIYVLADGQLEDDMEVKLEAPVKEIMTKRRIISISPEEEVERTIHLLSRNQYKKLPVVNGAGKVVGVISRGDLIQYISKKTI